MTKTKTHPHPKDIYLQGQKKQEDTYEDGEQEKLGIWRGGNTGAVVDGLPTGSCPRLTYLRTVKGWQPPHDETEIQEDGINSKEIMFGKGRFNEDFHVEKMNFAMPEGYKILMEEEIPVTWTMPAGAGSGRPDIVLCDVSGDEVKPVHMIEHKAVCGSGMAAKLFNSKPKLAHILQGANYACHLGLLPTSLVYTSSDYRKVSWAELVDCPAPGMPHSEHIKYTYFEAYPTKNPASKKGWSRRVVTEEKWRSLEFDSFRDKNNKIIPKAQADVKYIRPFMLWFDVMWIDGTVQWKWDGHDIWTDTDISIEDIYAIYQMSADMGKTNRLPPRPVALMADMKADKWSACGLCALSEVCNYTEKQRIEATDEWEELVYNYFKEEG